MNGLGSDRCLAIKLVFKGNGYGSFGVAASKGVSVPKFASIDYSGNYGSLSHSEPCEHQGYFNDGENDEDEFEDELGFYADCEDDEDC